MVDPDLALDILPDRLPPPTPVPALPVGQERRATAAQHTVASEDEMGLHFH